MDKLTSKQAKLLRKTIKLMEDNLNHPYVMYASSVNKVEMGHLRAIPLSHFQQSGGPTEVQEVRYKHHETRRKTKLKFLAQYLIDRNLLLTRPKTSEQANPKFNKDRVSCMPGTLPLSNSKLHEMKLQAEKDKISRFKKVKDNINQLKEDKERYIETVRRKSLEKASRSNPEREKILEKIQKSSEQKNKRIQFALSQKYKEIRERETCALKNTEHHVRRKTAPNALYIRPGKAGTNVSNDDDVDQQLKCIQTKINKSEEIHKRVLSQIAYREDKSDRIKEHRKEKEHEQEKDTYRKVLHIHQAMNESYKRRNEFILKEKLRLSKTNSNIQDVKNKNREFNEGITKRYASEYAKTNRKIEKRRKISVNRRNIQKLVISEKNMLKKNDQELNLSKRKDQERREKAKLLDRIKKYNEQVDKFKAEEKIFYAAKDSLSKKLLQHN